MVVQFRDCGRRTGEVNWRKVEPRSLIRFPPALLRRTCLTGTDGAITLPLYGRPQPLDGSLPDVLVTFDSEYFVEWQVADVVPLSNRADGEVNSL